MTVLRQLYSRLLKKPPAGGNRFSFHTLGFHGDRYLLEVADWILPRVDLFVETGTNVGSTLAYVAKRYRELPCLSCEPDAEAFASAVENTAGLGNVQIYNESSQVFLNRLLMVDPVVRDRPVLFWLDAHGYGFDWPLRDEIAFITRNLTSAFILIDDFKVPDRPEFGFDCYLSQECSLEYIEGSLEPTRPYAVFYPAYTDRTSTHHALRGWGLILDDNRGVEIPDRLRSSLSLTRVDRRR